MSNSFTKHEEFQFWENNGNFEKINNSLTPLQANTIINRLILNHNFSKHEMEELETLKKWIREK